MKKKIILILIISLFLIGCNKEEQQSKEEEKEPITYIDLYKEYLLNNYFKEDIKEPNITLINNNTKEPLLLVNYIDKDTNKLDMLTIDKETVNKKELDLKYDKFYYFYNIKEDKLNTFSYREVYKAYSSFNNYLNNENITKIQQNDFNIEYVLLSSIDFSSINKTTIDKDIKLVDNYYKKDINQLEKDIEKIKKELVINNENNITYKNYSIKYGKYTTTINTSTYTIKLNNDLTYEFESNSSNVTKLNTNGTCTYGYKNIYCHTREGNKIIEIIDNNKIKLIETNKVYSDKIYTYEG